MDMYLGYIKGARNNPEPDYRGFTVIRKNLNYKWKIVWTIYKFYIFTNWIEHIQQQKYFFSRKISHKNLQLKIIYYIKKNVFSFLNCNNSIFNRKIVKFLNFLFHPLEIFPFYLNNYLKIRNYIHIEQ